ncbi:zinc finger CCCH domain-containing protein 7B-like [Mantella aurantiaca]
MSSKKSSKKKKPHGPKTENASAEQVVFGLLSELLARGVEQGAYRWCLRKNADPKRTVFVSCVPSEMPNGVICSIMARSLNRGLVEIIDTVNSAGSVYQSLLVQAEGKIDEETCPTLIRCEDCPLGYWIMVAPVEDGNEALLAAKEEPPVVNELPTSVKDPPSPPKVSADKTTSSKNSNSPVLTKGQPAVKELLPVTKVLSSEKESPTLEELLPSEIEPSKQAKMLPGAMTFSHLKEPPRAAKEPPLPANVPLAIKELSALVKGLPSTKEPSTLVKGLPSTKEPALVKGPPSTKEPSALVKSLQSTKEPSALVKSLQSTKEPSALVKSLQSTKEPSVLEKSLQSTKEPSTLEKSLQSTKEPSALEKSLQSTKEPSALEKSLQSTKEPSALVKSLQSTKEPSALVKSLQSTKEPSALVKSLQSTKEPSALVKSLQSTKEPSALVSLKEPSALVKSLQSTKEPSALVKSLQFTKEPSALEKSLQSTKQPSVLVKGLPSTRESSVTPKMPSGWKQLPPPSQVLPAAKLLPSLKELPPEIKILPFEKEASSEVKGPPSPLNVLSPSHAKVVLSAENLLPSTMLSSPPRELATMKKNLLTAMNETDRLLDLFHNRKNFDIVVNKPNPSMNFGTQDRFTSSVTKLPNATYNVFWGGVTMERQKRREDIEKGLQFIQSTIPFQENPDENKRFLQELVENLYKEGNDLYLEGEVKLALGQYTEGLTVADYAESEELVLSQELVCKLFVNRSCCYYSMDLFEKSLEDSEKALNLDKENMRALYRKAKTLDKLGKHQEAYGCISHRILALVQDESVTELAQELVQKLGLKQRRAYKRPQQELEKFGLVNNGMSVSADSKASNGMGTVDDIYTDVPSGMVPFPSSLGNNGPHNSLGVAACLPSVAPSTAPATNTLNDFDCDIIGDELDSFLDLEMASKHMPQLIPVLSPGSRMLSTLTPAGLPASSSLPPASFGLLDSRKSLMLPVGVPLKPSFDRCLDTLDRFDSTRETLDSLDTFVNDPKLLEPISLQGNMNQKSGGNAVNLAFIPKIHPVQNHPAAPSSALPLNPLMLTYEFKQACQQCFVRIGIKSLDFTHREKLDHKCKKDILLGRIKNSEKKAWLKIRQRPTKDFSGPYMLCKDIQSRQDCKYGDNCTFAYYQAEIDVWNEEKKGTFHRDQLFQPPGFAKPGQVAQFLHEQNGIFTFLCQACFDSKPQIISKRNPENPEFCTKQHRFNDHKCLVHVLNSSTLKYSKVRPLNLRFQMDLCRHEMRYGCLQEDTCNFAHSHVELCVWMLQKQSGVAQEDIVHESERMWKIPEPKTKSSPKPLDMKMKFVCGQCLRNGREIEADRDEKYCTAKARHSWTKDKRVLLMMSKSKKKWVPIRPLPSIRTFPQQYEICVHVQNGKKCQYIGNCSFAHSTEEKDIWTYMKENKVLDLQQLFDLCNKSNSTAEKPGKPTAGAQKDTEKQILMPTDYADLMAGFHCYLCGKNSNSEKQWQKHIQSEKHKDRVFTLESEDSPWKYRFPAGEFKLCERFEETQSCPNENDCPFAHGKDELAEWHERRQVLQLKVSKARKDKLLEPSDSDFGKYSFLMQDLAQGVEMKEELGTL